VEVTNRELLNVFERHGIKRIDPLGEKFDPNLHQAVFEVPTRDDPPGTVVQVLQAGFTIGDRVLRPAMVGVARSPD
jgi:molecular chaperone GrpE